MATQIAVRIPEEDLLELDQAVARGDFKSRSAALRLAITVLLAQSRELEIAREYERGYGAAPQDEESVEAFARLAARSFADREAADERDPTR